MTFDGSIVQAGQQWDAKLYDEKHAFVWRYGEDLLNLLAPQAGEYILDIGAGTGHLTARIDEAGARVVGMDASSEMVMQARSLYPAIDFVQADAAAFELEHPFDAVFSNATLHWVKRAEDAARCIANCLMPGGRFVAELGGRGNIQAIIEALSASRQALGYGERPDLSPWYFPSAGQYASLLEQQGLEVTFMSLIDRPTPLEGEGGMVDWLTMFAHPLTSDLDEAQRAAVYASTANLLRPSQFKDSTWHADYRRLRLVARKLA